MTSTSNNEEIKTFVIRLPRDLWCFFRKHSVEVEYSMNKLILECMEKYRKKIEEKIIKSN